MQARIPKHVLVTGVVLVVVVAGAACYRLTCPVPPPVTISDLAWNQKGTTCVVTFKARNDAEKGAQYTFHIKPYHIPKGSRLVIGLGRRDVTMYFGPGETRTVSQDVRVEVAPRDQTPVTGVDLKTL